MLPKYRRLVEQLAQAGLLKVICGTDTLGVGINVPIRTVLLTSLSKYDGQRTRQLQAREFHQIAGRAGRAGFDTAGTVVVQAPEHEVENARLLAKAGDDEKQAAQGVNARSRRTASCPGRQQHLDRLQAAAPGTAHLALRGQPSLVLNVLAREGDPVAALRRLLTDNHEPLAGAGTSARAIQIYRSLLAAGVVERLPEPDERGPHDPADRGPAGRLRAEPAAVHLRAGRHGTARPEQRRLRAGRAVGDRSDAGRSAPGAAGAAVQGPRAEAIAAMKAEGVEYEERMRLIEEVSYPKPLDELLEAAFAMLLPGHPWLLGQRLSPKSVVRDMFARAMSFNEYVGYYGLNRSEGLVLRYLSDAYRALRSSVPPAARTESVEDLTSWLGELVRQVDSSLLDEWERLADPTQPPGRPPPDGSTTGLTGNTRAFTVLVRNAMFRRVELAARHAYAELAELDAAAPAGTPKPGRTRWPATSSSTGTSASGRLPAPRKCSWSTPNRAAGGCARSWTIRTPTGTGRSLPRSTWPPATRRASR